MMSFVEATLYTDDASTLLGRDIPDFRRFENAPRHAK